MKKICIFMALMFLIASPLVNAKNIKLDCKMKDKNDLGEYVKFFITIDTKKEILTYGYDQMTLLTNDDFYIGLLDITESFIDEYLRTTKVTDEFYINDVVESTWGKRVVVDRYKADVYFKILKNYGLKEQIGDLRGGIPLAKCEKRDQKLF